MQRYEYLAEHGSTEQIKQAFEECLAELTEANERANLRLEDAKLWMERVKELQSILDFHGLAITKETK